MDMGIGTGGGWVSATERPERPASLESVAFGAQISLVPHYLFYRYAEHQNGASRHAADIMTPDSLRTPYSWTIWRPKRWPTIPRGLPDRKSQLRFLLRSTIHQMHLFSGSDCGALLIYDHEKLVHYSGFTPRYWRFPFMGDNDLQVGNTWTDAAHRGEGLALFALQTILMKLARPGRGFWYVVEAINASSIRVAEKAQFALVAEGTWVRRYGLKLAGAYVICGSRT